MMRDINRGEKGFLGGAFGKYLPTPQTHQLILNYFRYNNFQDFNTWQQIAKTKLEYEYTDLIDGFLCKLTLQWDQRGISPFITQAQAKSKKNAKRKALTNLIDSLICQGLIAKGFREQKFLDKLPRRRKSDSDSSDEDGVQCYQEGYRQQIIDSLQQGKFETVLSFLKMNTQKKQNIALYEGWNYGLKNRSLQWLQTILKILSGIEMSNLSTEQWKESYISPQRQLFNESEVKSFPVPEDLTDFICPYQLQKEFVEQLSKKSQLEVQNPPFNQSILPSQIMISNSQTLSPSCQQLLAHFRPIEASRIILKNHCKVAPSFLGEFQHIQVPRFEGQQVQVKVFNIQMLFGMLIFQSHEYVFCLQVLNLLDYYLKKVCISFKQSIHQKYSHISESYYLRHKYLLTAEFLELIFQRIELYDRATSIQGLLRPIQGHFHYFQFIPTQMEQSNLAYKVKRNNTCQFLEVQEFSCRQIVMVVSKISGKWIGQLTQLSPGIRIYIPQIKLNEPHPIVIYRLCNAKLYQKTSASLVEAATKCMPLLLDRTFLIWQPPTYPQLSLITELLLEWQCTKQTVLLITSHPEQIYADLNELGFKAVKIGIKTEDKLLARSSVVVSSPNNLCCDILKNYAFSRVLVQSAQSVSQISLICGITKDCQQLWLIGDPNLPRVLITSKLCRENNMNQSLFERFIREGRPFNTYKSNIQPVTYHQNIIQWANISLYGNKLNPLGASQQLPVVKGFPWPSYDQRVCFLQFDFKQPNVTYNYQLAQISNRITEQVIRSGYTHPQQIVCLTSHLPLLPIIRYHTCRLLANVGYSDAKLVNKLVQSMVKGVSGSRYEMKELSIFLVGPQNQGVGDILGTLLQGRRGAIFIGDYKRVIVNKHWKSFLRWCMENKLICSFNI